MIMSKQKVGLDSQCLSYLIDAAAGVAEPTDSLAEERKALLRLWFYISERFYISETVVSECARIRQVDRREIHGSFGSDTYWGMPVRDPATIAVRTKVLLQNHTKQNDCLVLAEAEDLGLDTLLTYDVDFRKRLGSKSQVVTLITPSDFWISQNVPKGSPPKVVPHNTNPLSQVLWWRW
jgi:predicted nucleic acid-binding protein